MYYAYVIKNSKTEKLYYGYTNNLKRRLSEHNKKEEMWKLIYYEAYRAESDARKRKIIRMKNSGQAISALKTRIRESLS
ncbi:MAG: GIY-YIG nuclease family protein [Candidatus Omnitrophota bacterium]